MHRTPYDDSKGSSTFKIWLLNDDYATMEHPAGELFELEHEVAVRIMLQTHEE